MPRILTALLTFFALCAPAHSQVEVRGKLYTKTIGDTVHAVVELRVQSGWHIYHEKLGPPDAVGRVTKGTLTGGGLEFGKFEFPEPERHDEPALGTWAYVHHGKVLLRAAAPLVDGADPMAVTAKMEGLVCEDVGLCIPFNFEAKARSGKDEYFLKESEGAGAGAGSESSSAGGAEGGTDSSGDDSVGAQGGTEGGTEGDSDDDGLLGLILLAIGGGIFALLMPCTYPMIPITISFFTKQAIAREGRVLPLSLTYGAGIVLIFILIGLLAAPVIIPFAAHPVTNLVIGGLFLFFAFVLFGFVNLSPPQSMMKVASKASMKGGFAGVFLMGATLVITSFTCTAPFVGTLLGSAATGGDADIMRIVIGMGVFGLTMATPFVLLSLLPGKMQKMPTAGAWMDTLKVFLGFVEVAASLKFFSNADIVWGWELLSREAFLILWVVIFLAAGIYLIRGALPKSGGSFGAKQAAFGVLVLALSGYSAYGVPGNQLDKVMTAIIPPYSNESLLETFGGAREGAQHAIVKDDYEGAIARAMTEEKLVLINFTGFT
jgi:thiol:disulfide interchange protein DsbD